MDVIISPELLDFVKKVINNFITWDIIVFFYSEKEKRFTTSEISEKIGRSDSDILKSLNHLKSLDIINEKKVGSESYYYYQIDNENDKQMDEFVKKLNLREARLMILGIVLDKHS